ncbi:LptF/LptG family permease [Capnocytophaga sp. oral taxon 878]|uniref:LptF/LptG family permease n=1 Tax=Capnocytophaga sp. oral taxon 878 TaxID=1316596 RepID=UPI000D02E8EA|nr:LptF/LptG family permease [Capnocytophaga sp. oral taxon 878]AVM49070.1 permease [Capnocytophaga sp. oral taxon 878]
MSILDRYILTQFLKNFLGALSILTLIFVFHTIFTYIDELAGRGLELWIIGKFLVYFIPQLIPIIMPLAVVIGSIMTFGSFAENYEFAAMKASGISLMRIMRPVIILMALLSACTFFLANNVIPVASREVYNLRANIANVKPAMAIAEGIFSNIGEEFSIKVNKKHGDNDQFLEKVLIHKKNPDGVNRTVINAERGELKNQEGKGKFLQLILEDGTYYEDIKTNTYASQQRLPFAKVHFNKYVINIDLSHLNNVDFNEKTDATTYRMMNVNQLSYAIDSLHTDFQQNIVDYGSSMFRRTGIFIAPPPPPDEKKTTATPTHITSVNQLVQMVDEHQKMFLFESAINYNKSQMDNVQFREEYVEYGYKILNLHIINLSDKFALTVACFVLFFVAAPLGAFIRKGGIGLPLVVAMVLFLSYHFIGMFMKNIAENNTINPALAPWIPTLILLPLGIYLTHRVNTDKEMFHFPLSHKLMRYVEGKINNFKQKRQAHK